MKGVVGRSLAALSVSACLLWPAGLQAAADLRVVDVVEHKDKDALRTLLRQRVDVNIAQPDGATALHWAVYWDDLETVDLLLKAGAHPNAANDLGITSLFMACTGGNGVMVERLLAAGADPNTAAMSGETALMASSRTGSVQAVRALLGRGAKVNVQETTHGQSALMWAAAGRHPEVVRLLLEHGADVKARTQTRRVVANMGGNRGSGNATPDTPLAEIEQGGSTPLLFAAREGDVESARQLLAAGADVNEVTTGDGTSALVMATHSGNHAVANLLLDKGANPNLAGPGYTALHAAVLRSDLRDPLVELGFLREKEVEWRAGSHNAGVALVKALLAHGADPNARVTKATPIRRWSQDFAFIDRWVGATPFWLASKFLEREMMQALLASGANPALAITDGTTPLMAAAGLGFAKSIGTAAFVKDRRDFSYYNAEVGESAAAAAGEEERQALEAVKLVVTAGGTDVNATTTSGDTALHGAAALGMNVVVRYLVELGAKVDVKNKQGASLVRVAARHPTTIALLTQLGAPE
jgi:ankyrin repeat protein